MHWTHVVWTTSCHGHGVSSGSGTFNSEDIHITHGRPVMDGRSNMHACTWLVCPTPSPRLTNAGEQFWLTHLGPRPCRNWELLTSQPSAHWFVGPGEASAGQGTRRHGSERAVPDVRAGAPTRTYGLQPIHDLSHIDQAAVSNISIMSFKRCPSLCW
jgi:hypothetical protein